MTTRQSLDKRFSESLGLAIRLAAVEHARVFVTCASAAAVTKWRDRTAGWIGELGDADDWSIQLSDPDTLRHIDGGCLRFTLLVAGIDATHRMSREIEGIHAMIDNP